MAFVRTVLVLTLLAGLAACSSGEGQGEAAAPTDGTAPNAISLRLSPEVWGDFQTYLKGVDPSKHSAFAIANDGAGASAGASCDAATCADTQQVQAEALSACESKGGPCTLFAIDRVTQVPYRMPE